jgi:hypothetical protein
MRATRQWNIMQKTAHVHPCAYFPPCLQFRCLTDGVPSSCFSLKARCSTTTNTAQSHAKVPGDTGCSRSSLETWSAAVRFFMRPLETGAPLLYRSARCRRQLGSRRYGALRSPPIHDPADTCCPGCASNGSRIKQKQGTPVIPSCSSQESGLVAGDRQRWQLR